MSNNNNPGPTSRDTAEWDNAWDAVRRLAAARRVAMHDSRKSDQTGRIGAMAAGIVLAPGASAQDPLPSPAVTDSGQYARAVAEIEQASAALRRAEPALEAWPPEPARVPETSGHTESRHPRSVWILVGGIWISTVMAVASAIGVTLYLLG
jgi:hypothetical protein